MSALRQRDLSVLLPLLAELRHSTGGTYTANDRLQAFKKNVSSNDPFSHFQQRSPWATVRTAPSMAGGAHFGLLQCVGHIRPE
jgi:hypothetical protein